MRKQLYIRSKQMRGVKSVMYDGRCYKPVGTAPLSAYPMMDIDETEPFYKGCRPCAVGMIVLSAGETSDPVDSTTVQLQLTGYEAAPTSHTLHLSTSDGEDFITFTVDNNQQVTMTAVDKDDNTLQESTALKVRNSMGVQLINGKFVVEVVRNDTKLIVSVLKNSFFIEFTGLIWTDPTDSTRFSAPFTKLQIQVQDDSFQSSKYELYMNGDLVNENTTGYFDIIATGDDQVDEFWLVGDGIRTSNKLLVRTDTVVVPYPISHREIYYTTTTNSYGWGLQDSLVENITLESIRESIEQYGPKFRRLVRVQDFLQDDELWGKVSAGKYAGRVVSNWNDIQERYSDQGASYFLTNSPTVESKEIYWQSGTLDCKVLGSGACEKLNSYFLGASENNKSAFITFTFG